MKKIIYCFAFLVLTAGIILAACSKQEVRPNTNIQKTGSLSEADLIDIIQGRNPHYTKIEQIEEILFDNCQLSSPVIRALIDDSRFPNYIIEEMMILSAPVSNADLTYAHTVRPSLSTNSITASGTVDWSTSEYVVYNTSPRQIFVAKGLTCKSLCADGCGESEYKGNDFIILNLASATVPLNPAEIAPCDNTKWFCGKAEESHVVVHDESITTVVTKCVGTEGKYVRRAAKMN